MADEGKGAEPELRGFRSPYFREIVPDYVFGGTKAGYIEMIVVTTKASAVEAIINKKDVIEHTEEVSLKISPYLAKSILVWMLQNIKSYEKTFGKAEFPEEDNVTKREISKKVEELIASL